MDASSTTVNISSEPQAADPGFLPGHTHKANFGRYVDGCPRCAELHPEGSPSRTPVPTVSAADATLAIENERLRKELTAALLAGVPKTEPPSQLPASSSNPEMEALIQLMLRKETRGLEKEEEDRARMLANREQNLNIERSRIELQRQREEACERTGHVKENGRTAVNGQVHNDGMYHPVCFHCFKEFPPVRPGHDQIETGIQVV